MKNVILGTAHLKSTPGKCSPDKSIREYEYSRKLCKAIKEILESKGVTTYIDIIDDDLNVTTSQELVKRVNFVNSIPNSIYVSIHLNGAGDGSKWMNGSGWECYTTPGKTNSDKLAECLYNAAKKQGLKLRTDVSDGDMDKEANLFVIKKTNCPAVLTENLFQDNKEDVKFLLSKEGFQKIVNLHIEGIMNYIK